MNRKYILCGTALIVAMMLSLSVAPTMAKPDTIVITVKYIDTHKPVVGADVTIRLYELDGHYMIQSGTTDNHGKFSWDYSSYSYIDLTTFEVIINGVPAGGYPLDARESARITIDYPILA